MNIGRSFLKGNEYIAFLISLKFKLGKNHVLPMHCQSSLRVQGSLDYDIANCLRRRINKKTQKLILAPQVV
jgi:hypothetical protein